MFGNHGLCGLLKEGAHEKSPKYLGGNLGDFGEFCKGLMWSIPTILSLKYHQIIPLETASKAITPRESHTKFRREVLQLYCLPYNSDSLKISKLPSL